MAEVLIMCLVWLTWRALGKRQKEINSFCTGFCIAQAISGLCGRYAWLYSVTFGEVFGFIMLAVTAVSSVLLFGMLWSERSGTWLTAVYIIFSSGNGEYTAGAMPILNTAADGFAKGIIAAPNEKFGGFLLMIISSAAGQLLCMNNTAMPAAFGAIACCALLCRGVWEITDKTNMKLCCAGAVSACLLAYF